MRRKFEESRMKSQSVIEKGPGVAVLAGLKRVSANAQKRRLAGNTDEDEDWEMPVVDEAQAAMDRAIKHSVKKLQNRRSVRW